MLLFYFFMGASLSSFFTCISSRKKLLSTARSRCDHCQHPLSFYQLIPIISYMFQHGRCLFCQRKIPITYFYLELFGGIICSMLYYIHTTSLISQSFMLSIIIIWLLFLAIYDIFYYEITWSQLIFLLIMSLIVYHTNNIDTSLLWNIMFWLSLELITYVRPNSFGGGDAKILAILSLTLPYLLIPHFLFICAIFGLAFYLFRKSKEVIPFIPCITIAYTIIQFTVFI